MHCTLPWHTAQAPRARRWSPRADRGNLRLRVRASFVSLKECAALSLTTWVTQHVRHDAGTTDSDSDIVLKGVVRVENLDDATEHIADVLARVKPEYLVRHYFSSLNGPPLSVYWLYSAATITSGPGFTTRQLQCG